MYTIYLFILLNYDIYSYNYHYLLVHYTLYCTWEAIVALKCRLIFFAWPYRVFFFFFLAAVSLFSFCVKTQVWSVTIKIKWEKRLIGRRIIEVLMYQLRVNHKIKIKANEGSFKGCQFQHSMNTFMGITDFREIYSIVDWNVAYMLTL